MKFTQKEARLLDKLIITLIQNYEKVPRAFSLLKTEIQKTGTKKVKEEKLNWVSNLIKLKTDI